MPAKNAKNFSQKLSWMKTDCVQDVGEKNEYEITKLLLYEKC